jgi:hypothetical protein
LAQQAHAQEPGSWFTGNQLYNLCRGYSVDGNYSGYQYVAQCVGYLQGVYEAEQWSQYINSKRVCYPGCNRGTTQGHHRAVFGQPSGRPPIYWIQ